MKYVIDEDIANGNGFVLFLCGYKLGGPSQWVGTLLKRVGYIHSIDMSECFSESHALACLQHHGVDVTLNFDW